MPKFQTMYKCLHRQPQGFAGCKSVVQPNRSLSIQDVVSKFASGQTMDLPQGEYGIVKANLTDYDLADRVRLRRELSEYMTKVLGDIRKEKADAAAAAKQKEIDDAVAARLAKQPKDLPPRQD